MAPKICDPANCPTGQKVNKALQVQASLDARVETAVKSIETTNEVMRETHDAVVEQSVKLDNVVDNMERDRQDWKEDRQILFTRTTDLKDRSFTTKAAGFWIIVLGTYFTVIVIAIKILEM